MFLAFAYLFVSLAHSAVCFDEAFTSIASSEAAVPPGDSSDDGDFKKSVVAGHCHVCAPIMMPAFALDAGPSVQPIQVVFNTPPLLLEDHPWLDTPPPKHLT